MNNLQVFNFGALPVNIVDRENEPWFIAKDICDVLELSNPTMAIQSLDEDQRSKLYLGRQGEANIINESGLYTLIVRSNKPNAKQFRKWVTSEVLPSIRKHGVYATPDTVEKMIADPDTTIQLLNALKRERTEKAALLPKAAHSDLICDSNTLLTTTGVAKRLGLGAITFNKWLVSKDILRRDHLPAFSMQKYNLKYYKIVTHQRDDGKTSQYVKWTEAGARYLIHRYQKEHNLIPMEA
jgi:prophage antirepressor-like protein